MKLFAPALLAITAAQNEDNGFKSPLIYQLINLRGLNYFKVFLKLILQPKKSLKKKNVVFWKFKKSSTIVENAISEIIRLGTKIGKRITWLFT